MLNVDEGQNIWPGNVQFNNQDCKLESWLLYHLELPSASLVELYTQTWRRRRESKSIPEGAYVIHAAYQIKSQVLLVMEPSFLVFAEYATSWLG